MVPDNPEALAAIKEISSIADSDERHAEFQKIASEIGIHNEQALRKADMLLAVLDGMEPDSGTCSELGFACALGKVCHGLRTDLRDAGDFSGLPINLQLLCWIGSSGGSLLRSLQEVVF